MFIVRLDYQNGLHKEYSYSDLGLATNVYNLAVEARSKGIGFKDLIDDAGRTASFDGGKLQSVELVDIQAETISAITLIKEVQGIQQQFGMMPQPSEPRRAPPQPVERDDAPEYQPAIGTRRPQFAS